MSKDSNSHIVAKNTFMVYTRMILVMGINLYTSRVILDVLGIDDYGIYNVVSGLVIFFSFLNNVLSTATQRFLSYDLGCNNIKHFQKTFSVSMSTHIAISIIVILLCETIGLWFLNYKMEIPESRLDAANWVFQICIINCCSKFIRVPYNACIISYERMSFFAYIGILEVILGLVSVYFLYFINNQDKLILYTILVCISSFIILWICKTYCTEKLKIKKYTPIWDKELFKSIFSFSGWSLLGGIANLGAQQGVALIINLFFGVAVNAAIGIANQVGNGVYSLVTSFQTAFTPQLVKLYAKNDNENFINLIIRTSKFSFYLIFILALPIMLNMKQILNLWLVNVPQYTEEFCLLVIVFFCIDALSSPLWNSIQATGKIKYYQITVSIIISLTLPCAYILLKLGYSPITVLTLRVVINVLVHFARIFLLKKMIKLPVKIYLFQTFLIPCIVVILSVPIPLYFSSNFSGFNGFIISSLSAITTIIIAIYFVGITKSEKQYLNRLLISKLRHE